MFLLPLLNLAVAIGGLVIAVITIVLFVDHFLWRGACLGKKVIAFAWPAIIATTTGVVALSLVYSEYLGFAPCSLCWLQRIALYPQALLAIIAFRLRDDIYFPIYGIALSLFGGAVALYHYVYQLLPQETRATIAPCLSDGTSADCAAKVIDLFGFVTFPLLSAITFAFLIALYLSLRRPHVLKDTVTLPTV